MAFSKAKTKSALHGSTFAGIKRRATFKQRKTLKVASPKLKASQQGIQHATRAFGAVSKVNAQLAKLSRTKTVQKTQSKGAAKPKQRLTQPSGVLSQKHQMNLVPTPHQVKEQSDAHLMARLRAATGGK